LDNAKLGFCSFEPRYAVQKKALLVLLFAPSPKIFVGLCLAKSFWSAIFAKMEPKPLSIPEKTAFGALSDEAVAAVT